MLQYLLWVSSFPYLFILILKHPATLPCLVLIETEVIQLLIGSSVWKLKVCSLSGFTPGDLAAPFLWGPPVLLPWVDQILPLDLSPILLCRSLGLAPRGLEGLQGMWVEVTQVPGPSPNSCFYYSDPTRCQLCCVPRPQNTSDSTSLKSKPLIFGCFWNTVLTGLAVFSLTFALAFRDRQHCQFPTCSGLLWGKSLCSLASTSTSASIDSSCLWSKRSAVFPPFAFPLPRVSVSQFQSSMLPRFMSSAVI